MIAIDTNILVYARREEVPLHRPARALLERLANGKKPWAIPWPCACEFLRVVTHPRVFDPPTRLEDALEGLESLLASPSLTMLGEGPVHRSHLRTCLTSGRVSGNLVHDAHIAALAVEHGVTEFLSHDADFARFPGLRWKDPFASRGP